MHIRSNMPKFFLCCNVLPSHVFHISIPVSWPQWTRSRACSSICLLEKRLVNRPLLCIRPQKILSHYPFFEKIPFILNSRANIYGSNCQSKFKELRFYLKNSRFFYVQFSDLYFQIIIKYLKYVDTVIKHKLIFVCKK